MRTLTLWASALLLAAAMGCNGPGDGMAEGFAVQAVDKGLALELSCPQRSAVKGDTMPVTITARNTGKEDMVIQANSGALVYVTLWRYGAVGWEQLKRFPETAVMIAKAWTLKGGRSHAFKMNLKVTADWPTSEPLKLSAALNGKPDLEPAGIVKVFATREEFERDKAN